MRARFYFMAAVAGIVLGCADPQKGDPSLAGGGIETTNNITGMLADSMGKPVAGSPVILARTLLTPNGDSAAGVYTDTTDSSGRYAFSPVPKGTYVVKAAVGPKLAFRSRIRLDSGKTDLGVITPRRRVILTGRLLVHPNGETNRPLACVAGFSSCVYPDEQGVYHLPGITGNDLEILFIDEMTSNYLLVKVDSTCHDTVYLRDAYFAESLEQADAQFAFYESNLIRSFSVLPVSYLDGQNPAWYNGKAFDGVQYFSPGADGSMRLWSPLQLSDWPHSRPYPIAAPAGAPRILQHFPYLLRLTDSTFDFSQAAGDGRDLRVSKDGIHSIPYYISRWDSAAGQADVWILLDSLYLGDTTRNVTLHWGMAGVQDFSQSQQILHPPLIGAWHLEDNTDFNTVADARGIHPGEFYQVDKNRTDATRNHHVPGVVGGALELNGSGDQIRVPYDPELDVTAEFSLFLWAKNKKPSITTEEDILAKWSESAREWLLIIGATGCLELHFGDGTGARIGGWRTSAPIPNPDQWHAYAATFSSGTVHLYVDGVEVASELHSGKIPTAIISMKQPLTFGAEDWSGPEYWEGYLDEIRYSTAAWPADWISALYWNQKPQ